MKLLKKHERDYILGRSRKGKVWELDFGYEIKSKMINRMPKVIVTKNMHQIKYKDDANFAIEPEPRQRPSFDSRIELRWEVSKHTEYKLNWMSRLNTYER